MSRPDLLRVPLRPSPEVVSRRIAGEHLLVPVRSGALQMDYLFTANEAGSLVFRLLDGRRTADELARAVAAEFEVDESRAQRDVLEFLGELLDAGLIAPAGEAP
jgi:hypothetical protein